MATLSHPMRVQLPLTLEVLVFEDVGAVFAEPLFVSHMVINGPAYQP
jgi:hypothetical protein